MKDDGFGIAAIKELEKTPLPEEIVCVDGGTSTLDMLKYFMNDEQVIIIDCLKGGQPPGTIYKIVPEEIMDYKRECLSLHNVQILDVIKIANQFGFSPAVTVYGVEPQEISEGVGLTKEIQNVLPQFVRYIKNEIKI